MADWLYFDYGKKGAIAIRADQISAYHQTFDPEPGMRERTSIFMAGVAEPFIVNNDFDGVTTRILDARSAPTTDAPEEGTP